MNTKNIAQEQISAFADGELADSHVELALAALHRSDGRATWDAYHQIGDVLRSEEMACTLSQDFQARMAARLDAEPTVMAPMSVKQEKQPDAASAAERSLKRYALPGIAAAAVASLVFVTVPQLMVATNGAKGGAGAPVQIVATVSDGGAGSKPVARNDAVAVTVREGVILRDPRIDEYLLAHQRFSPSVFSTAQYARSATFATDSEK